MMTAESTSSKHAILRITAALFFLLNLFLSHIYFQVKQFPQAIDQPQLFGAYRYKMEKSINYLVISQETAKNTFVDVSAYFWCDCDHQMTPEVSQKST